MSSWKWHPGSIPWRVQLIFALAFTAWVEGADLHGDFARGLAAGLASAALVMTLAERQGALAIACAGLVAMSTLMAPRAATGAALVATHVLAAAVLGLLLLGGLHQLRMMRRAAQQPSR